ncbi:hypothetical protein [Mangrovibacillus cuniculi]|uniref:Uncharacterized protein n=1 Tax=Mangrovibacillus cuniculi TaxID=2593652 RepID=A0A7S8CBD4_9BACI|nr:hypothetical protein [Mangrovibacillus cuniculi]QPC46877.1 hypothetical protein G8O30_07835 [Mangrovibacillus cuniculi]
MAAEYISSIDSLSNQDSSAEIAWWVRTGEDQQWLPQSRCFSKKTRHHMLHLIGEKQVNKHYTTHTLHLKNQSRIPIDVEVVISLHFGTNGFSFVSPLNQSIWRHEGSVMNVFELIAPNMTEKRAIMKEFTFSTKQWNYQPLMVGPSVSCFHLTCTLKGLQSIHLPFVHIQAEEEQYCKDKLLQLRRQLV